MGTVTIANRGEWEEQTLSATKQALLEKRLRGAGKGAQKPAHILRRALNGPAPLSFTQQQLWLIEQFQPCSYAYNLPSALRLRGPLDRPSLERSLNAIVHRHEILRATFPAAEGNPAQLITADSPQSLPVIDLEHYPAEVRLAQAQGRMTALSQTPFDLAQGPLIRWHLLKLEGQDHILLLVMHHIISDGWSLAVFYRELELLYKAGGSTEVALLPVLPVQYADYAWWQQEHFRGEELQKMLRYWKEKLAGAPASTALPVDHERPAQSRGRGARVCLQLDRSFHQRLSTFAHEHQATRFIVMITALAMVLNDWTRQADLVIGTVSAGRTRRELENLAGCFMNFLPLRARVDREQSGLELLSQVKAAFWEALAHQDCPYEKIVEAINPERKLNQNPLYNVGFLMQNWPRGHWTDHELRVEEVPVHTDAALLDLRWIAEETEGGLMIACEYDLDLFEAGTVRALLDSFKALLEKLVTSPQALLREFQILPALKAQAGQARGAQECETLAIAASFTAEPLEESLRYWTRELDLPVRWEFAPYNQLFQQLLDPGSLLAANQRGLNILLLRMEDWMRNGGANTAGEALEHRGDELLRALQNALARSHTPFLVCFCPGLEASPPAALRASLQKLEERLARAMRAVAGVYVLTPEDLFSLYPVEKYSDPQSDRLGHVPYTPIFFTALGTMIIRQFHALKRPPKKVIALDCDQTLWSGVCGEDGPAGLGLEAPRLALQRFLVKQYEAGTLLCLCSKNNEDDVWAVFEHRPEMPLRREHFAAWRLNWRPKSENLRSLAAELKLGLDSFILLDDNPVECAEVEAGCPGVLALLLPESSEQLPGFLKHAWIFDHAQVTNEDRQRNLLYQQQRAREQLQGNSLSFAEFLSGLGLKIDIQKGTPGQAPRLAQLTQRTNQFNCTTRRRTENEIGQLLESGAQEILAISVLDRFGDYGLVGLLMYRRLRDALEVDTFLLSCRALGKGVEHQMLAHLGQQARASGLGRVDVQFIPSPKNQPALKFLENAGSAFRQGSEGGSIFRFPADYAAGVKFDPQSHEPSAPVEPLPVEASAAGFALDGSFPACRRIALNAQVPRAIYEAMEAKATPQGRTPRAYAAPRNVTEQQLCEIWAALLRLPKVGIHDDFFELGGTSLLAVRFFAEVQKAFGKSLPLVTLFQAPTIAELARIMDCKKARAVNSSIVAIQPRGARPPLVLVHGAGGGLLWGYANLAMKLGGDQPVYAIEPHQSDAASAPMTVEEMAARYARELCDFQPQGPYYLGGYCFGGYIAFEMACQLRAQGKEVALVALIDAAAPNGSYDHVPWWRPAFAWRFAHNFGCWFENFRRWKGSEQRRFLRRKTSVAWRKLLNRLGLKAEDAAQLEVEDFIDPSQFPEDELRLWRCHLRAGSLYVPQKYPGEVILLRTRVQPIFCSLEPHYGWGELARAVRVKIISGSHENIFVEPDLESLADALKECLAAQPEGVSTKTYELV